MADILDHVEGEEYINPEDIDENAILGDDINDSTNVKKEEVINDDLYDAAIEPTGVNEKRDSLESTSTTSIIKKEPNANMLNSSSSNQNTHVGSSVSGKRYCCYIGNMTWWTTDVDLQNAVAACGVNVADFVDLKFHENRNNGQSKGFALAVFSSEAAVRAVSDKLSHRKIHGQNLVVLPYNKQSLAKLEDATKRVDSASKKDDKQGVLNIGTVRIGPAGSSSMGVGMNRSLQSTVATPAPTNLMNITFPAGGPSANGPPTQFQIRPGGSLVAGTTGALAQQSSAIPALLQNHIHSAPSSGILQTQIPPAAQLSSLHQTPNASAQPLGFSGPPPSTHVPPPSVMNRPPPNLAAPPPAAGGPPTGQHPSIVVNTSAPPPGIAYQSSAGPLRASLPQQSGVPPTSQPGFPPGAHINPQVYPSFAQGFSSGVTRIYPENGGLQHPGSNGNIISEAEFEEIMNRNRTVSSSAINRAVSDATAGDYGSAIETLVTAISLIRQSRVAGDDRCKVLIAALQDTLQGIESKSYNSRKHRSRDRSPSERTGSSRKRHRGRGSRSRSRSRDRYDYSRRY